MAENQAPAVLLALLAFFVGVAAGAGAAALLEDELEELLDEVEELELLSSFPFL